MSDLDKYANESGSIPDGHMIVGFVGTFKVIDENSTVYWGTRCVGLNDMEAYGMSCDMANSFERDLQRGKEIIPRKDDE